MMIKNVFFVTAVSAAIAVAAPVFAANAQLDGQLPMYPHGTLDAKEASLTPEAIAHGVPLVLLTSDSVSAVETWYGSRLPKACAKQRASGGVKFGCPGGSVMVYPHDGKTQIALIPPMPGFR